MASIESFLQHIAGLLNSNASTEDDSIFVVFAIAVIAGALWLYPLPSFFDLSNHLGFVCAVLILVIVFGVAMALTSPEEKGKNRERDLHVLSEMRK